VRYAAYGSNLHPLRLRKRVPSAELIACVGVPNWQLRFHKKGKDGSGKCNIVPADGSVYFAVFEIAADDKPRLDGAEGLNIGYNEISIDFPDHGRCFSYTAAESHIDKRLIPYAWYKELVIVGLEYHRLPSEYVDSVRAVEYQIDANHARHEKNMAIVMKARNGS